MHCRLNSTATPLAATLILALLAACSAGPNARSRPAKPPPAGTPTAAASSPDQQVADTERAFAQTLANRDLKAFIGFLSQDAVFFSGNNVEHGPAEIANVWAPFFSNPHAPFSWQPDHVEVTPDGRLALSTGPVMQDDRVVGRFNSVWRREEGNTWRIVFDKGEPVCGVPPDRHVTRSPQTN
jgi:ketosteroid isomerase-like protein